MSKLKIRDLLDKDVKMVKEKLGINSYTWGEHREKMTEALSGATGAELATFFSYGSNADKVAEASNSAIILRTYAFYECNRLNTVNFPEATSIGGYAFEYCRNLNQADFSKIQNGIGTAAFKYCLSLKIVILRNTAQVAVLSSNSAFADTPIASGTGYIYVPKALLDSYKTATNWTTYKNQFRALEDYTVDGTTTGDLDESKI